MKSFLFNDIEYVSFLLSYQKGRNQLHKLKELYNVDVHKISPKERIFAGNFIKGEVNHYDTRLIMDDDGVHIKEL